MAGFTAGNLLRGLVRFALGTPRPTITPWLDVGRMPSSWRSKAPGAVHIPWGSSAAA